MSDTSQYGLSIGKAGGDLDAVISDAKLTDGWVIATFAHFEDRDESVELGVQFDMA